MTASSISEYIDRYDGDVRDRLLTVYELIRSAVPDEAVESISWRMPTFKLGTVVLLHRNKAPHRVLSDSRRDRAFLDRAGRIWNHRARYPAAP